MIHHILSAKFTHLTPNIIKNILGCADKTNKNGVRDHYFHIENFSDKKYNIEQHNKLYCNLSATDNIENIKIIRNKIFYILRVFTISSNDKIIFHSNQDRIVFSIINAIIYIFHLKKKAKSISFVCWGTDFAYGSKFLKSNSILRKIKAKMFDTVWSWYGNIITLDRSDEKKVKDAYGSDNIKTISYLNPRTIIPVNKDKSPLRIMVSHSGWFHNNHHETFKLLERFKNEDIEVWCPLCYGVPQYIDNVISEGKRIFGKKFKYFTELMPINEYERFINQNHVYITATETQNGLGAINRSIESNCKVFLKDFYYKQFSDLGYKVFRFSDLENISLIELQTPLGKDNINCIKQIKDKLFENSVDAWRKVYN